MFQMARVLPQPQPGTESDKERSDTRLDQDDINVKSLEALLAGHYDKVESDDGPAGKLMQSLSSRLAGNAAESLKNTVRFSMLASESMVSISHMAHDLDQVNDGAESMAAVVEEMSASISEVARNSGEVSAEAGQVEQDMREGSAQVGEAINSMGEIKEVVEGMSARLAVLEEAAGQIGGMAQSIEDISNQTKLLALNATIEAARAGEAGKGFAVVASEVKSLSEQTSKATDEIRVRIATLNSEMKEMAAAMEISADKVHAGEGVIGEVGNRIEGISGQIASVSGRMAEIASVLDQQRGITTEIAGRVNDMAASSGQALEQAHKVIRTDCALGDIIDTQFATHDGQDIPNYVLHRAKSDHLIWKKKLAIMISGVDCLDPDELADHHSCRLGKWYDQVTDPALKTHPSFQALVGPHEKVHHHGRETARALAAGDKVTAFQEYELMETASVDVIRLLDELTG